ncbi:nitroreductase/quinone reductase family protein [Streptomyces cyaneofuscatus]|nr:nitroreductase/quinone reductase family protein [Streptomyces cyaneofuscatus]
MTTRPHSGHRSPPPCGRRRRLARLSVALYRVGLGPLLGRHLLLLHHTDRISGDLHHTLLEVAAYDAKRGHWILVSSPGAAWYRDLQAAPMTTIQVRNHHYAVTARFPSADEDAESARRYAAGLSRPARRLCIAMGIVENGGTQAHRRSGHRLALLRLDAARGQHLP